MVYNGKIYYIKWMNVGVPPILNHPFLGLDFPRNKPSSELGVLPFMETTTSIFSGMYQSNGIDKVTSLYLIIMVYHGTVFHHG